MRALSGVTSQPRMGRVSKFALGDTAGGTAAGNAIGTAYGQCLQNCGAIDTSAANPNGEAQYAACLQQCNSIGGSSPAVAAGAATVGLGTAVIVGLGVWLLLK